MTPHIQQVMPISTLTAQPMFRTKWLRITPNDAPAGWRSIFETLCARDTDNDDSDRNTTGLCVTCGGVVDRKSRLLKPTAQSTTELRNRHMIDTSNRMSGRVAIWEELRAWHGLASVFWLLAVIHWLHV